MTVNGYRVSFWGDVSVLMLGCGDDNRILGVH